MGQGNRNPKINVVASPCEAIQARRMIDPAITRQPGHPMPNRLTLLGLLLAATPAHAQLGPLQHIQIGPLDRTYVIERNAPAATAPAPEGRLPVIIFLHGLGALVTEPLPPRFDTSFAAQPGLPPVLVVHPQGVNRRWDSIPAALQTWQRLSATNGEPVDDIAFIAALIDHVVGTENADPARIYVAGISAGGYLVPRIACELPGKVAAVADIIATARTAVFHHCDGPPISFALLASTTDDVNPYAGAPGDELNRLASAPDTAAFFAQHDHCTTRTETPLPHLDPALDSTASEIRSTHCANETEVLFLRIDGSAHSVPSTTPIGPEGWPASGRRNRDIDTAQVLWDFFKAHQTTQPP